MPGVKQELTHQCPAKILVWDFHQQHVAEIPDIAQKRQIVSGFAVALNLTRQAQPHLGLTNQIQCGIGQGNVLFKNRRMATPFADPMTQDQGIVAHTQQELKQGLIICERGCHYIAPTSSGMSKKVG